MRSIAYKLTGATAVASALGFLLRWLQDMRILDTETGLAAPGMAISYIVVIVIILVGAAIAAAAVALRRCECPEEPERALAGATFLHTAAGVAPAVLLMLSGLIQIMQAGSFPQSQIVMRRICGAAAFVGGVGAVLMAAGASKPERAMSRRIGAELLILFGALWVVAVYKSAASDPVLWRYAVEILAVCVSLLAVFRLAGYFFRQPNAPRTIFYCHFGAFLCVMSAIDEHTVGESICYAAMALFLFVWGFTVTANLRRAKRTETPPI